LLCWRTRFENLVLFSCKTLVQNRCMTYGYARVGRKFDARLVALCEARSTRLVDSLADTTTSSRGRLILTVLGNLAEFEREQIRARTSEARARAKSKRVKPGRKPILTPHRRAEVIRRREAGGAVCDIARTFNIHHSTISRLPAHV
jgi:DNA invertase Pin-like site-specific DNA recombinase